VPVNDDLTTKNTSYEDVSQWNGKDMKEIRRYLLGVVTQSLQSGSPAQHSILNRAIGYTPPLLEIYLYARYISHDDATLSYMEAALHRFNTFNNVFLLRQAGDKVKAKATALGTKQLKKRKVNKETNAETWTPSTRRHELKSGGKYISHEIIVSKELVADYQFQMIHLMSHCVEQIRRYGALQQYSA
jgi:hypothetical protein